MLRAIELSGFKSFADRTRLEFADGISALIGPNGSGKSNIVDAIKWVLGEQSMKKLRGCEATDVIFNGAAGRAPMGAAEVTLTFDNQTKTFDLDTPEVHLTRRIYRSGEGEYLINRQAARLKDIKDLLIGTGLGTQAYSIIEQGRVEGLLQSSPVQRRVIFEEAAGISRFNARKQEALRRMERVDQMMVRIGDMVTEVGHQLQTTRTQAGKAKLYREYSSRLQELRKRSGHEDYLKYSAKIDKLKQAASQVQTVAETLAEHVTLQETEWTWVHSEMEKVDLGIRRLESEMAATRQQIVGDESNIEVYKTQIDELEADIVQTVRQLSESNHRRGDMETLMQQTTNELDDADRLVQSQILSYNKLLEDGNNHEKTCCETRERKNVIYEEMASFSQRKAKQVSARDALQSKYQTLQISKEQGTTRLATLMENQRQLQLQTAVLQEEVSALQLVVSQKLAQIDEAKQRKSAAAKELARRMQDFSEQKQRQSALRERISVLEELIRKNEGLNPGVKAVLHESKNPSSPFRHVFGLVADLFRVDVEAASLIELALGQNAQKIVVSPKRELFKHTEEHAAEFPGRVTLTWLDPEHREEPWDGFSHRSGVVGRADRFVKADPKFTELVHRLLGKTWIVENISVARKLYQESDNQTQFITLSGEMLTPDGSLSVGPLNTTTGIITRRSELRTLLEQQNDLDAQIVIFETEIAKIQERVALDEIDVEAETSEYQKSLREFDQKRMKLSTLGEQLQREHEQEKKLQSELEKLEKNIVQNIELRDAETKNIAQLATKLERLEQDQIATTRELEEAESLQSAHFQRMTHSKIELAKSEERLEALKERLRQLQTHFMECQKTVQDQQGRIRSQKARRDAFRLAVLQIEAGLASLYVSKEQLATCAMEAHCQRAVFSAQRDTLEASRKKLRQETQKVQAKLHAQEMEIQRSVHEQQTLVERMREDFDIDVTDISGLRPMANETDRAISSSEVRAEMESLRLQIGKLGSVNLEAMETLEELEARYETLSFQYNDILESKKAIEKIIERNNTDSRRLFEETFEGVKLHFRELFQQLFGGGVADLVLENPNDILESGIDIVAKPPGKELKSVTLLSGGEKTMTCVALLLAFFRFRPNPVCILDECDAALDEGNIDRFVRVIKEFRTQTQFLMITHSRQTMAAASSIYGVTMQESGVSKPISVQFTDISENGEFSVREAA